MFSGSTYDFDFATITQSDLASTITITTPTPSAADNYVYATKKSFVFKCVGVIAPSTALAATNKITVDYRDPSASIAKEYDVGTNS